MFLVTVSGMVFAQEKIAIIFATGGLGDKSFNDSAYEGIERAKEELGIEYDYVEPEAIAEYETYLTQFAASGEYSLIISIGFDHADSVDLVSSRFPDQYFAIVDSIVEKDNVASYVFDEIQRGFLPGVAAAMMTSRTDDPRINSEKIIGVVGGMNIPLINKNIKGFAAGAKFVDPEIEVVHSYVGGWADPGKGKELAYSMVEQGADVIWGAAGRSGLGVINASIDKNVYSVGSNSDQSYLAPKNVLTNGMKYVNNTVFMAVKDIVEDKFEPGTYVLGFDSDAVGITKTLLSDDVYKEIMDIKEKVVAGEIDIEQYVEELE